MTVFLFVSKRVKNPCFLSKRRHINHIETKRSSHIKMRVAPIISKWWAWSFQNDSFAYDKSIITLWKICMSHFKTRVDALLLICHYSVRHHHIKTREMFVILIWGSSSYQREGNPSYQNEERHHFKMRVADINLKLTWN